MFFTCEVWCIADVLSVSPSSEQTARNVSNTLIKTSRAKNTPYLKHETLHPNLQDSSWTMKSNARFLTLSLSEQIMHGVEQSSAEGETMRSHNREYMALSFSGERGSGKDVNIT